MGVVGSDADSDNHEMSGWRHWRLPDRVRGPLVDLAAGTFGGVNTVLVGQPLDTVKVKMQTFPELYPSVTKCIRLTFQQDGLFRGLYAGTSPAIVANVAENAVLFCAYGVCQRVVQRIVGRRSVGDLSAVENASAGGLAAIFSSLTLCPTELVKCKSQALRETSRSAASSVSMTDICRIIYREEGARGFFRGLGATMAREIPGYFAFFGGYELSRQAFAAYCERPKQHIGPLGTAVSGGIGGISLWLIIYPADLVKSRMQVLQLPPNVTAMEVAKKIVRSSGVQALYSGLLPTLIRTFPATGVLFLSVEFVKDALS